MLVEKFHSNSNSSRIKDTFFIIWIAGVVVLSLALLTHSSDDKAIDITHNPSYIENSMGIIGAQISQVLFDYLGFAAYLLPILLTYIGYLIFCNNKRLIDIDCGLIALRIIGFNFLIVSTCTLIHKARIDTAENKGGHVGYTIYELCNPYLGYTGTLLLMITCFVLGFVYFTGISIETICEKIGSVVLYPFTRKEGTRETYFKSILNKLGISHNQEEKPAEVPTSKGYVFEELKETKPENTTNAANSNKEDNVSFTISCDVARAKFGLDKNKDDEDDDSLVDNLVLNKSHDTEQVKQQPIAQPQQTKKVEESRYEPTVNLDALQDDFDDYSNTNSPVQTPVNTSRTADVNANSSANVNQNLNTTFPSNRSDYQGTVNSGVNDLASSLNNTNDYVNDNLNNNLDNPTDTNNAIEPQSQPQNFNPSTIKTNANANVNGNKSSSYVLPSPAEERAKMLNDQFRDASIFFGGEVNEASTQLSSASNQVDNSQYFDNMREVTAEHSENVFNNSDSTAPEFIQNTQTQVQSLPQHQTQAQPQVQTQNYPQSDNLSQNLDNDSSEKDNNVIDFSQVLHQNNDSLNPSETGVVPDGFSLVNESVNSNQVTDDPFAGFVQAKDDVFSSSADEQPATNSFANNNSSSIVNSSSLNNQGNTQDLVFGVPSDVKNNVQTNTQGTTFGGNLKDAQTNYDNQSSNNSSFISNSNSSSGYRVISAGAELSESLGITTKTFVSEDDNGPYPTVNIFEKAGECVKISESDIIDMVNRINQSFKHFNVPAHVATTETFDQYGNPVTKYLYQYGPVITRYKVKLEKGLAKAIVNISNDIARFLCVGSMRVIEVIPGEPYIGLEIPNVKRGFINMRQLLESDQFQNSKYDLPMVIGKDIVGNPVVLDLVKAPHLLVAGTTGSGKSVGISTMLVSLLMRHTPKELRLILIDPKMLEFSMYHDIPHLLTPVITDVKQSPSALRWCVQEMERRYTIMSKLNVKKITDYNNLIDRCLHEHKTFIKDPTWKPSDSMSTEAPNLEKFPFIVIVVDEFADLILQLKKNGDIEGLLARLAAKARACGIHLILATQSPRADVITGVIRSNFPSQISFKVKSNQESRIIIDESGAESLLGMGDMLIKFNDGTNITRRAHGAYIKDSELEMFAESWRRRGKPEYVEAVTKTELTEDNALPGEIVPSAENKDPLYDEVVEFCRTIKLRGKKFSTSLIQRQFSIGYNRAARLTTTLEECGIVSEAEGGIGTREILIEVNSFD